MKDPIVEKIRSFRDAHAKKFNYNLDSICEDLQQHQLLYKDKWAKLKPRKTINKNKSLCKNH